MRGKFFKWSRRKLWKRVWVFLLIEEFNEEQYKKWNRSWFLNYEIGQNFIRSNEAINFLCYEIARYSEVKLYILIEENITNYEINFLNSELWENITIDNF